MTSMWMRTDDKLNMAACAQTNLGFIKWKSDVKHSNLWTLPTNPIGLQPTRSLASCRYIARQPGCQVISEPYGFSCFRAIWCGLSAWDDKSEICRRKNVKTFMIICCIIFYCLENCETRCIKHKVYFSFLCICLGYFWSSKYLGGAWGSVVVKALHY
jgi:hypothetical protein